MSANFYQGDNNFLNKFLNNVGITYIKLGKSGLPVPYGVAGDMVSLLPNGWFDVDKYINNDVFDKNSYADSHRVIDICCNSGAIIERFYYSFMSSLARVIPRAEEREDYILKNLLYAFCLDEQIARLLRMRFYWSFRCKGHVYQYNIIEDSGLDLVRARSVLKDMRFDVVCGNPPYNNDMYLDFVMKGHELSKSYDLWITPAKFIAKNDKSGKNDNFRKAVLGNIKDLVLYIHTHEVFSILSDGGIAYYLCDKNSHTGINVNNICNEVPDLVNSSSRLVINKDIKKYSLINISDSILDKLYSNGFNQYHPKKVDELSYNFYLTSQFGGSGAPTNRFFANDGKALVLSGYEILEKGVEPKSDTTMRLFSSDNLNECNNYLSWIYSKFVRFLLICGMCVRSSVSDECWRFVPDPGSFDRIFEDKPLMGYTPDENGEYIDADGNKHCSLYVKYKLTDEEINIIESVIRERK